MSTSHRAELQQIRTFPQLIRFLRDEMGWPIESEEYDDLVFDYEAEELGLDAASAAKIKEIKRLRPLAANQPWGIFFVSFEPKRLPVVALRRILSAFVMRKRESANAAERMAWETDDLLFISNYGEGEERQLSFAHFSQDEHGGLPTLRVLGWDNLDTPLHLDHVADQLTEKLAWPRSESDVEQWRETWGSAFTLRHGEVIATSKALAVRLAVLARAIRDRVRTVLAIETDSGPVTQLMKGFKEALVHDLEADDFADMYAQTVAYGLLSARIANPKAKTAEGFAGQLPISSPFLGELMGTFLHVGDRSGGGAVASRLDFDELGVSEVVELLDSPKTNMEAVVRDFGDKNPQEDPVIHFYEDFLREYDKKQKVKRGVFYTPRPVVSYIVRSVDELLRSEFGLADGLADITTWGEMIERHEGLTIPKGVESTAPFVTILDLATGTGTFLVETIDVVHRTLVEKWKREGHGEKEILDLWNDYVPKHLLPRLYGYELLMAPYAIAHLKIGLKLHETGYRFRPDDRLRVYLTNSLEPASDIGQQALTGMLPALAHEAHAVNDVKRTQRFTVVIGNPPYAGLSANMSASASALIEDYKYVDGKHFGERKHWLHDDYVKFVRIAQLSVESAGAGVVGLITNHAFFDNPTFRGMRWSLLRSFSRIRVLDLHGNTMRREQTPDGTRDQNVFDIQQGVGISVLSAPPDGPERLRAHGDLWGSRDTKYALLGSVDSSAVTWQPFVPHAPFLFFVPRDGTNAEEYERWPSLTDVFRVYAGGFITARDDFVVDTDRDAVMARIAALRDAEITDEAIRERYFKGRGSPKYPDGDSRGWKLPEARRRIIEDAGWQYHAAQCLYRPFDFRWIYWTDWMVDWPRPEVNGHLLHSGNIGLAFMRQAATGDEYSHFLVSRLPVDNRACYSNRGIMTLAPLYLFATAQTGEQGLPLGAGSAVPNFTERFIAAFSQASDQSPASLMSEPDAVLSYAYACFLSPQYRERYSESLRTDYPRLPLPGGGELFRALTDLGGELIAIHLMESPKLQESLTTYVGPPSPVLARPGWLQNTVWFDPPGVSAGRASGPGRAGIRGVPEPVWGLQLGGYQVCEKWLKDRKGRTLSTDDIAHYQKIIVALSETMRLMQEIDEVIEEHGGWPGAFSGGDEGN